MTEGAPPDLRIGRVLRAHGVRGGVRVESLTDFPDRFHPGRQVTVGSRLLTISRSQESQAGLILNFAGVEDREAAATLRGAYITVPLSDARALPAGHYYHFQLVGLEVLQAGGQPLGTVEEVLSYPANDVLRVSGGSSGERLVPMVSGVIVKIDRDLGRITVDLREDGEA